MDPLKSVTITSFKCRKGRFFARSLAQSVSRGSGTSGRMTRSLKLYGELELIADVQNRRLQYLGHVVRMGDRVPKKIPDQHPGGRRKPGRLRKRWLDDVTNDLEVLGIQGCTKGALDRKEWVKSVGEATVLHGL
jgi:hypothetical protein